MSRIALLLVVALVGCSGETARPVTPAPGSAAEPAPPPAPGSASTAPARRCLPVVAKECGCVYDCGIGASSDGQHWRVTHAFWKDTPLDAVVEPWCVDGKCTDAFAAQIVCSVICPPKPARDDCKLGTPPC